MNNKQTAQDGRKRITAPRLTGLGPAPEGRCLDFHL